MMKQEIPQLSTFSFSFEFIDAPCGTHRSIIQQKGR